MIVLFGSIETHFFLSALFILYILELLFQLLQAVRLAFQLLFELMDCCHSGFGFTLPCLTCKERRIFGKYVLCNYKCTAINEVKLLPDSASFEYSVMRF